MRLYKNLLTILLAIIASCAYAHGTPIPIASCSDLRNMRHDLDAEYYLVSKINCAGHAALNPIDGVFTGTLDGRGYAITSLNIENPDGRRSESTGIFRTLGTGSVIRDLEIVYVNLIAHADANRGVLAGEAIGDVLIENVMLDGVRVRRYDVNPNKKKDLGGTGSVVGLAKEGTLTLRHVYLGRWNAATGVTNVLNRNAFLGGLIGIAEGNLVIDQSSVSNVEADGDAECYNPSNECGIGGLIGLVGKFQPHNYDMPDPHVPGLAFGNSVIINEVSARGKLFTFKNVGGFVGTINGDRGVFIQNSYSLVNFDYRLYQGQESKYTGGLIGKAKDGVKMIMLANIYVAGEFNSKYGTYDDLYCGILGNEDGGRDVSARVVNGTGTVSYYDKTRANGAHACDMVSIGLYKDQILFDQESFFGNWDPTIWKFGSLAYPMLINVDLIP